MDSATFLMRVAEALEYEGVIARGQTLEELVTWDSLDVLSIVSLLDELGARVETTAVVAAKTAADLIALAGSIVHE
jgi:acyl carrier protein